ncbi:hypothetical protein [Pedobacter rhizosphaerae]|uniref:Fasciclin domain-containing protein n=1 Tax=Pedobacter rhizosphaerae TaxID=390241 RepID=A0A1H9MT51_9SPHI|nr:hypothetical protein [Pedobacter rhizosphaerae]SER26313.1 hypothetical protein SAMN04488023_106111 [Pedobacter rhizosphaerae]
MKNKLLYFIICSLGLAYFTSCKKSNYLTDGGLSEAKSPLTTYEYLKQHKYHLFDTLIMVIDHYNMKDEVNGAATFFAPTNYSINNYIRLKRDSVRRINENNTYTLTNMYNDIKADSLRIYLSKSRIELTTAPLQPTLVANAANTQTAFQRILQPKPGESWSSSPIYYLYYIKVRGGLDPPNSTVQPNDPNIDLKAQCQTTGIEPSSGGMLHVLSNTHTFIRF